MPNQRRNISLVLLATLAVVVSDGNIYTYHGSDHLHSKTIQSFYPYWFPLRSSNVWYLLPKNNAQNDKVIVQPEDVTEGRTKSYKNPSDDVSPRFFFNGADSSNGGILFRPNRFGAGTLFYTTTKTTTIAATVKCVAASQLVNDAGTCARRRRYIDEALKNVNVFSNDGHNGVYDAQSTSVQGIQTTDIYFPGIFSTTREVGVLTSSKEEPQLIDGLDRAKRFFNIVSKTLTSWSLSTTTFYKTISLAVDRGGVDCEINGGCLLDCVPPGLEKCKQ